MKIKFNDELLIVYLYNQELKLDELENLKKDIKIILEDIINRYKIKLSGIYEIIIYENKKYGYVLEIKQIKEFEYSEFIDLRINIKYNQTFYFITDNYNYIDDCNNVFCNNDIYFVNMESVLNVNSKVELCDILYKDVDLIFIGCVKIK